MTLATSLAALKASLDAGNDQFTNKHFRLLIEALESFSNGSFLSFGTAEAVTIASGAITATGNFHAVETEGLAASDDLATINGGAEGDLLMLRANSSSRTVVVKSGTGNLVLMGERDFSLDSARDRLLLSKNDVGEWVELSRVDVDDGFINLGTPPVLTIASGAVTPVTSFHAVDTEAAAAADDLDTITAVTEGDILYLRSVSAARVVTLVDGGGNLRLAGNFVMSDPRDLIGLLCFGSTWVEFTRSDNN